MKIFVLILSLVALAACNTIEGAGEDIERGGEHIQEGAENVKEDMKKN